MSGHRTLINFLRIEILRVIIISFYCIHGLSTREFSPTFILSLRLPLSWLISMMMHTTWSSLLSHATIAKFKQIKTRPWYDYKRRRWLCLSIIIIIIVSFLFYFIRRINSTVSEQDRRRCDSIDRLHSHRSRCSYVRRQFPRLLRSDVWI